MHKDRIKIIHKKTTLDNGKYILYWMQSAQRIHYNHALNYAIDTANKKGLPLIVLFNIVPSYPEANLRHYTFMLEGLVELTKAFEIKGIEFVITFGEVQNTITPYLESSDTLIMDRGYLKPQRKMRNDLYKQITENNYTLDIIQIETEVLIPVESLYPKAAYGAYVLRPNVMKKMYDYMDYKKDLELINKSKLIVGKSVDISNIQNFISKLPIDQSIKPFKKFVGGYSNAVYHLNTFLDEKLKVYDLRSEPALHIQSYLSMYVQFGQIDIQDILNRLFKHPSYKNHGPLADQFIEQLITRRELAYNFVTYHKDYDRFESMTEPWAYETMHAHADDIRTHIYSKDQIENSLTHDIYFNAAMTEARITGFMANYMRMYWAKKIMEWSSSMKDAYEIIVYLNNKYFIDGRNPNSYGNIAWNFGKHDRAWQERPVFGKIRYMNAQGLVRKFNMEAYIEYVNTLEKL